MAMRPCQKCKRNKWKYGFRDETRMVTAICKNCGFKLEFKAKPRKPYNPNRVGPKAEYEIKDGKRFLKIDGEFVEVELCSVDKKGKRDVNGKYLRVMPVIGNKVTLIAYCQKTF